MHFYNIFIETFVENNNQIITNILKNFKKILIFVDNYKIRKIIEYYHKIFVGYRRVNLIKTIFL